jgi:photosystem II stability/assembly factor-like uncharacterized protein
VAVQGLRATSRGGHIALQEATRAQFGSTVKAFRSFGRFVTGHHGRPGPRAHDGGATWTERSASPLPSQAVLDFVTPAIGFATVISYPPYRAHLLTTSNGGRTWTAISARLTNPPGE